MIILEEGNMKRMRKRERARRWMLTVDVTRGDIRSEKQDALERIIGVRQQDRDEDHMIWLVGCKRTLARVTLRGACH